MNRPDFFGEDTYWKRHIHRRLEEDMWIEDFRTLLPESGKALDLGCGIGQYSRRLMEYGLDVVSADLSDLALEKVSEFNPNTRKLDMRHPLPFADREFQLVFASLSIHYFSDAVTRKLMAEIRRILAEGGMFVGSVNGIQGLTGIREIAEEIEPHFYWVEDRYARLFDKEDLIRYLDGFTSVRIEERETIRFENKKNYLVFLARK